MHSRQSRSTLGAWMVWLRATSPAASLGSIRATPPLQRVHLNGIGIVSARTSMVDLVATPSAERIFEEALYLV